MMRMLAKLTTWAVLLGLAACSRGEDQAAGSADAGAGTAATPAGAAAPAATGSGAGPRIRPGLWRTVMSVPGAEPSTGETCVRAGGDTKPMTGFESGTNCGDMRETREGSAWVTRATCTANEATPGGTVEARATGDFQSRYTTELIMRSTGGQEPEMRIRMESTRVGDC